MTDGFSRDPAPQSSEEIEFAKPAAGQAFWFGAMPGAARFIVLQSEDEATAWFAAYKDKGCKMWEAYLEDRAPAELTLTPPQSPRLTVKRA